MDRLKKADPSECFEITHPKEVYSLHVCTLNNRIAKARIYIYLWSDWDSNLSDGIMAPDAKEGTGYDIPSRILVNPDLMDGFKDELLKVRTSNDAIALLYRWSILADQDGEPER